MAGLALLGVAVGALLVGLVSLGGGDNDGGDGGDAAPPGSSTEPTTTGDTTAPGDATPTSAAPAPAPTSQPQVPSPAPTTASPAPPPPPEPREPVRVYNNSKITGLAAQAADDFRRHGWVVQETSNYSSGNIPTSTVYYRPGTNEEAAARALGSRFNLRVEPRFDGIAGAGPGLIVIVTNDYGSK
jgi:hypothetical protein